MMRKLLALVPLVALAVTGPALVASAGVAEEPAPATSGYTILVDVVSEEAAAPETASSAPESQASPAPESQAEGDVDAQPQDFCEGRLATVDFATGVVTPLPAGFSLLACAGDLAFGPDGTLYGLVLGENADGPESQLVTFDLTSGAATLRGVIGGFNSLGGASEGPVGGITFDASGTLFALLGARDDPSFDPSCPAQGMAVTSCLYRVDPANPADATFVGVSVPPGEVAAGPLASSCTAVYAMRYDGENPTDVTTVDTSTAALSPIGQVTPAERFVFGADFDNAGTFWSVLFTRGNPATENVATLNPQGGTPIQTLGAPILDVSGAPVIVISLAVEPLICPIVLQPTFTG